MSTAGQGTGGILGDNLGRLIVRLKPRRRAQAERRPGDSGIAPPVCRRGAGLARIHEQSARDQYRRPGRQADYQMVRAGIGPEDALRCQRRSSKRGCANPTFSGKSAPIWNCATRRSRSSILRDRAAALGVSPQQIESALYNAYGGRQISTLYGATDQYLVLLELDPRFQRDINALRSLYVQSSTGRMVPIHAVADISMGVGPGFGEPLRAAAVGGAVLQPGARRLDRRRRVAPCEELARETLPSGRHCDDGGQRQGVPGCVPHAADPAADHDYS